MNRKSAMNAALTQFRRCRTRESLDLYCDAKNSYVTAKRSKKRKFQDENRRALISAQGNEFWNLLKSGNSKSYNHSSPPPNVQFEYFSNLFAEKSTNDIHLNFRTDIVAVDELDREINTDDVIKAVRKAKANKSGGIDGFPINFWKCVNELYPVIARVLNCVFHNACYPESWRVAIIVPLFKSGDPMEPTNYRALSLLPSASKITSSIIADRLSNYMENRNLLLETHLVTGRGFQL